MLERTPLFLLLCTAAFAQTGAITGRIIDPGGAIVPNVQISITETSTGIRRVVSSIGEAYYTAPSLLPGPYAITVEHQGFKPISRTGLQLQVDQELRVGFTPEVGALTERIVVQAEAPLLETETQSVAQVVQGRQIVELPLLGRDPYAIRGLVPGVRVSRGMNDLPVDQISTVSVSINGARRNANEFQLDGALNTAPAQNQPIVYPNALPWLQDRKGIAGHVLGGWELGVVASFYSGSPLGVTSAVNGTNSSGVGQRPKWTGMNPGIDNPSPYRSFDTSVFSTPAAYQFGTGPRTFSGARSDATRVVDLSLHKNTYLTEKLILQFRSEAFNLANTPVFSPPNTSFGAQTFGTVSSQADQPRILQFAMKLNF